MARYRPPAQTGRYPGGLPDDVTAQVALLLSSSRCSQCGCSSTSKNQIARAVDCSYEQVRTVERQLLRRRNVEPE